MIFMCQMLCNTHLTRPNKIKSNQSSPVHQQTHWRSVNDALASCWNSVAMVGEALTADWRRYIHWRRLAIFLNIPKKSPSLTKHSRRLTTADDVMAMHWRRLAMHWRYVQNCWSPVHRQTSPVGVKGALERACPDGRVLKGVDTDC